MTNTILVKSLDYVMTQTFQVIVMLIIALCIVGIVSLVQYHRMDDTKSNAKIVTGIILILCLVIIVSILIMHLNKNCLNMSEIRPEVGTAKDLAALFD